MHPAASDVHWRLCRIDGRRSQGYPRDPAGQDGLYHRLAETASADDSACEIEWRRVCDRGPVRSGPVLLRLCHAGCALGYADDLGWRSHPGCDRRKRVAHGQRGTGIWHGWCDLHLCGSADTQQGDYVYLDADGASGVVYGPGAADAGVLAPAQGLVNWCESLKIE